MIGANEQTGENWEVIGTSVANRMVVMPSNNSGLQVGYLAGKYPGRLGWLIGPGGWRKPPSWMPVALDNGAFGAWAKNQPWDERAWWNLLSEATRVCLPLWAIVPDVVMDKDATIESWHKWELILRDEFPNLPLAMAVQDGMTPEDVPAGAQWIFVGGATRGRCAASLCGARLFQGGSMSGELTPPSDFGSATEPGWFRATGPAGYEAARSAWKTSPNTLSSRQAQNARRNS